jgi:hypothetical protein
MSKATKYWAMAFVLLIFVVIIGRASFTGGNRHASKTTAAAVVKRATSRVRIASDILGSGQSVEALSASPGSNARGGQVSDNNRDKFEQPIFVSSGGDASAIGIPFPISASVGDLCKRESNMCGDVPERLAKMAQEPRDQAWATETEGRLQDNILSQGSNKYSIRDIECRTSLCAVEVASAYGPYVGLGYEDQVKFGLLNGQLTIGAFEKDPAGARITVTVITFTRR